MRIREKTYALLRKQVADRKAKRAAVVDALREDEVFDDLLRQANSLRWDRVLEKGEKQEKACALLKETEQKIEEYLSEKGYSKDILSDTESCGLCHDTGVYQGRMCRCAESIRERLETERSPLLKEVPDSLAEVDVNVYGENASTYKKYLNFLKKAFLDGELNYAVIGGKTGTGKTYIGCTAAKECMKRGGDVLILNAITLGQKLLAYHCAFLENKQELWEELSEPDLLCIDDLGVEPILTNVTVPYLYALLVDRIDKKTVITTNLDLSAVGQRYGQRILSRLMDKRKGAAMVFEGEDIRF